MALSPEDARVRMWEDWMRRNTDPHHDGSKVDCRVLIDAADNFMDSYGDEFNALIPQPARGIFSSRQKAFALLVAMNERFKLGI